MILIGKRKCTEIMARTQKHLYNVLLTWRRDAQGKREVVQTGKTEASENIGQLLWSVSSSLEAED